MARLMKMLKPPSKVGVTSIEIGGEVVSVEGGRLSDSHFISPEADPEGFRMIGALTEMLLGELKKTFAVDSLLVIAQNEDFKIIMFPRGDGIAVWKTNSEVPKILRSLERSGSVQENPVHEGRENLNHKFRRP
jgi:hypothetical protein